MTRTTARVEWVTALGLTGVALGLQLVFLLHAGALWRDEANSVETASAASWPAFEQTLEFESFPAAWLGLLRVWMALASDSDDALRIAGALGGVAIVAAIWLAMWRMGRAVPLMSLALLAINPEVVRWSGSVRAWGLGAALALAAMVALYDATVRPTRGRVILAAVVCTLSVHCVYQNVVLLGAIVAAALLVTIALKNWKGTLVPLGIGAVAVGSLLPYLGVVLRRREWDGLNQMPFSIADLWAELSKVILAAGSLGVIGWIALAGAVVFAGRRMAPSREQRWYLTAALVLSAALTAALYLGLQYPTRPWYYLSLLSVAVVAGELFVSTAPKAVWMSRARVAIAVIVTAAGAIPAARELAVPQSNMDIVAAALATRVAPGDVVVASPWYYGVSLSRYHRASAGLRTIPPMPDVRVHRYDLLKSAMQTPAVLDPLLAELRTVLAAGGRVWIVGPTARMPDAPHGRLPPPPLAKTGWQSAPYEWNWMCEAGSLLVARAATVTQIPLANRGGPYEDAGLLMLQGWR